VEAGAASARDCVADRIVIANLHPEVFPAIAQASVVERVEALGVLEGSCRLLIEAADAAVKSAEVTLVEIRLAMALGGKAFAIVSGHVSAVRAAIETGKMVLGSGTLGELGRDSCSATRTGERTSRGKAPMRKKARTVRLNWIALSFGILSFTLANAAQQPTPPANPPQEKGDQRDDQPVWVYKAPDRHPPCRSDAASLPRRRRSPRPSRRISSFRVISIWWTPPSGPG